MVTLGRTQTVLTGVAGAPYYSNLYWDTGYSAAEAVEHTAELWEILDNRIVNEVAWEVSGIVEYFDDSDGIIIGAVVTDAVVGAGEAGGEMLPSSTQVLVKWRTGVYSGGREIRGRTFVPALDVFMNDEGSVEAVARGDLSDELATWLGGLAFPPRIWSRTHGDSAVVAAAEVWEQFAVLRSRRD